MNYLFAESGGIGRLLDAAGNAINVTVILGLLFVILLIFSLTLLVLLITFLRKHVLHDKSDTSEGLELP